MQRIKFCPVYVQKNSQDCTGKGITYNNCVREPTASAVG